MFSGDLEGHAPSWPHTACDFGGPRFVVAVFVVLKDATAARPSITPFGCGRGPR